jgi:hypothetical protein
MFAACVLGFGVRAEAQVSLGLGLAKGPNEKALSAAQLKHGCVSSKESQPGPDTLAGVK